MTNGIVTLGSCKETQNLERRMGTAQKASTLGNLKTTRNRKSRHKLVIKKWNITPFIPTGKEHEFVEETTRYSPDVDGISSTECRCSNTVELDDEGNFSTPPLSQHSVPNRTVARKSWVGGFGFVRGGLTFVQWGLTFKFNKNSTDL